jgi:hypothetical protein
MGLTLYEVVCRVPMSQNDGRNTAQNWGHEHRFHATRESAERSSERLQTHGGYGQSGAEFWVEERDRESFSNDVFGLAEWKQACREAGVRPTPQEAVH